MDISEIRKITDETQQVEKTYEYFNEDTRLNRSKAARVEFLTTAQARANTVYILRKKALPWTP